MITLCNLLTFFSLQQVDENMKRAEKIDSYKNEKFFFRQFVAPPDLENPVLAEYVSTLRDSMDSMECDPNAVSFIVFCVLLVMFLFCSLGFVD
jgi:hypothetical protein